jgi:hypothetical protein
MRGRRLAIVTNDEPDYDDPVVEQRWCEARRAEVVQYRQAERIAHGRIGDWPAWYLPPLVSVWAIESAERPDWVGAWVISGDLPADVVSAADIKHPRDALRAFVERWRATANDMAAGRASPGFSIGTAADWPTLGPMLASRAELLAGMADDADLWDDD